MGGPLTDMVDQAFYKKTCKKALMIKNCFTQNDTKYFFDFFKELIRIDLFNMENVKYIASLF